MSPKQNLYIKEITKKLIYVLKKSLTNITIYIYTHTHIIFSYIKISLNIHVNKLKKKWFLRPHNIHEFVSSKPLIDIFESSLRDSSL